MFDGLFDLFAETLNFFYTLVPNYAIAIGLLTLLVMVITTPFTLKGTRSMIQMQRLQPEMRKLQIKYKDDRQKLNEELMAFYKENSLNPLGGCLPLLLQTPIFIILYNVIQGLTRIEDGTFDPKYLKESSELYQALDPVNEMIAFGVDLAESAREALSEGFVHGLPHVLLVVVVALSSYYQQRQIQGRNPNAEVPPQQKMLMRVFPAMFVVIAFVSPAALVVYFVVSNLYRIGMQHYITRTLYHGEESLGAQAQRAAAESRKLREEEGGPGLLPRVGRRGDAAPKDPPAADKPSSTSGSNGADGDRPIPRPTSRTTGSPHNRSKKKKKRR
jgi:YidC/Oxa1 family membrane protein insertase